MPPFVRADEDPLTWSRASATTARIGKPSVNANVRRPRIYGILNHAVLFPSAERDRPSVEDAHQMQPQMIGAPLFLEHWDAGIGQIGEIMSARVTETGAVDIMAEVFVDEARMPPKLLAKIRYMLRQSLLPSLSIACYAWRDPKTGRPGKWVFRHAALCFEGKHNATYVYRVEASAASNSASSGLQEHVHHDSQTVLKCELPPSDDDNDDMATADVMNPVDAGNGDAEMPQATSATGEPAETRKEATAPSSSSSNKKAASGDDWMSTIPMINDETREEIAQNIKRLEALGSKVDRSELQDKDLPEIRKLFVEKYRTVSEKAVSEAKTLKNETDAEYRAQQKTSVEAVTAALKACGQSEPGIKAVEQMALRKDMRPVWEPVKALHAKYSETVEALKAAQTAQRKLTAELTNLKANVAATTASKRSHAEMEVGSTEALQQQQQQDAFVPPATYDPMDAFAQSLKPEQADGLILEEASKRSRIAAPPTESRQAPQRPAAVPQARAGKREVDPVMAMALRAYPGAKDESYYGHPLLRAALSLEGRPKEERFAGEGNPVVKVKQWGGRAGPGRDLRMKPNESAAMARAGGMEPDY